MNIFQIIWNLFYKKNYVFIIRVSSAINVFPKITPKKNLATPLWWPPLEPPNYNIFAARYISRKKTSAFIKSKNWSCKPRFVGVGDLCRLQTPRVEPFSLYKSQFWPAYTQLIFKQFFGSCPMFVLKLLVLSELSIWFLSNLTFQKEAEDENPIQPGGISDLFRAKRIRQTTIIIMVNQG